MCEGKGGGGDEWARGNGVCVCVHIYGLTCQRIEAAHPPTVVGLGEVLVVQHEVGDDGVERAVHRVQQRLHKNVAQVVGAVWGRW